MERIGATTKGDMGRQSSCALTTANLKVPAIRYGARKWCMADPACQRSSFPNTNYRPQKQQDNMGKWKDPPFKNYVNVLKEL
eukprot:5902886-Amphidinium_carterae.1